jgi:hypothetical protein
MRHAARVDGNQAEIVAALRESGASVFVLKLPVDLLVGYAGKTALVEIKDRSSAYGRKGLNEKQSAFLRGWNGGTVALIDSVDAAQWLIRCMSDSLPRHSD